MKKVLLYIFTITVALLFILFIAFTMFISNFNLFDSKRIFLDSIYFSNCNQTNVSVFNIPSDATIESSIQVLYSIKGRDSTILIEDYERFNKLKSIKKVGDCAIEIMVEDTIQEVILTDTLKIE